MYAPQDSMDDLFEMDMDDEAALSPQKPTPIDEPSHPATLITPLESNMDAIEHARWDVKNKLKQKANSLVLMLFFNHNDTPTPHTGGDC